MLCRLRTLWRIPVNKVRLRSECDLLQDDGEAVDVSFLSSVDRSSCHTQQLRCCTQLIAVILTLVHLCLRKMLLLSTEIHSRC